MAGGLQLLAKHHLSISFSEELQWNLSSLSELLVLPVLLYLPDCFIALLPLPPHLTIGWASHSTMLAAAAAGRPGLSVCSSTATAPAWQTPQSLSSPLICFSPFSLLLFFLHIIVHFSLVILTFHLSPCSLLSLVHLLPLLVSILQCQLKTDL